VSQFLLVSLIFVTTFFCFAIVMSIFAKRIFISTPDLNKNRWQIVKPPVVGEVYKYVTAFPSFLVLVILLPSISISESSIKVVGTILFFAGVTFLCLKWFEPRISK